MCWHITLIFIHENCVLITNKIYIIYTILGKQLPRNLSTRVDQNLDVELINNLIRFMAEILPIRRKTPSNQSINLNYN